MLVLIKGAGDIASAVACTLFNSGFKVIMSEIAKPSAIRRSVSFASCVYLKEFKIGNTKAKLCDIHNICDLNESIAVVVDEDLDILNHFKFDVFIDATLQKKNQKISKDYAKIVIGIGPGFIARVNTHAVIESARGHDLGKIIYDGKALEDTKIPGEINGVSKDRVIYSPFSGVIKNIKNIGDIVKKGEIIAKIDSKPIKASIDGVLRGIINDGYLVSDGLKIADIDPRISEIKNCFSISDKARNIAGSCLEAIMQLRRNNG